ncbi:MAG: histidine kinase [Asticcacaulis sp.]|uniref:sensor histidine kinase n=1 Tax=Asticcacaulis sp. TaxID=1872648 RepID=UPI0025BDE8BE|nr:sensor histidine kinase [Asticcacaulis sp.]MCA1936973.1 histidine kinase [Asticcacaulis sp.]
MVRLIRHAIIVLLCLWPPVALAQSAFFESFTQDQGLNDGEVSALAQDGDGFIWIGADSGLIRYDGVRFQHWFNPGYILDMQTAPDGCVFFRTRARLIYRMCKGQAKAVTGPDGTSLFASSIALDAGGRLVAVRDGTIWIQEKRGWRALAAAWHGSQKARRVFALNSGDELGVITGEGAYLITRTGGQRVIQARHLNAIIRRDAHSLFVVGVSADKGSDDLWLIEKGRVRNLTRPEGRFLSWVMRNGTLWLSSDTYLLSVSAENRTRLMQQSEGINSGGPLLVDRENSLWLGTFTRLLRFPEPETANWQEPQGLKVNHVYRVFASQTDVWVTSWKYGANRFSRIAGALRAETLPGAKGVVCSDGRLVWHVNEGGQRGGPYSQPVPDAEIWGCYTDESGTQWLAASEGLFVRDGYAGYRLALDGFGKRVGFVALWPSREGGFWLSDGFTTCLWRPQTRIYERCFQPRDYERVFDGAELPDGRLWVIKESDRPERAASGVSEVVNGQWRDLAGSTGTPGQGLLHIRPSPRGGYWISGKGTLLRIAPCRNCREGWQTLEAPATAQGLAGNSAKDVIETESGDLWIAGNNGVWRIPAAARSARPVVKGVRILQVNIDGRAVSGRRFQMEPRNGVMEIVFTALSYKQADLVTYRYRSGADQRWTDLGHQTRLQWTRPGPGDYRLQISASQDGVQWTPPAEVQVKVVPPWFQSLPALIVYACIFGGLLWGAYYLRVRHLLALERQRTLIAMDLHDELGASLSSIAMLATAARYGRGSGDADNLTSQIASLAHRSGLSLRSLGQTLAVQAADPDRFAWEVTSQTRSLMPTPTPRVHLDLVTDAKGVYFHAHLRRQLLLILMEALTNIKKHALASEVIIRLRPEREGELWELCVEDDGKGMGEEGLGSGMMHMRQRAEAVGAQLNIQSQSPGGTCIRLRFSPSKSKSGPDRPDAIGEVSKFGIRPVLALVGFLKKGANMILGRATRRKTKEG